jgi:hypothetical protein
VIEVRATLDVQGLLHFACPFYGRDTFFRPDDFRASAREIRTVGVALCEFRGCNVPYEIVHSYFMPLRFEDLNKMCMYQQWYMPEMMHAVWKARNERRRE